MKLRIVVGVLLVLFSCGFLYGLYLYAWQGPGAPVWSEFSHAVSAGLRLLHAVPVQSLLILGILALLWLLISLGSASRRRTTTHGSARYATWVESMAYAAPSRWHQILARHQGWPPASSLVLGRYKGHLIALTEKQQESNVLVVGPVGQYKSSGIIIPGLLQEVGSRSFFATDPKGELFSVTAGAVAQHHEVWLFAPNQPAVSQCYNPLASINSFEDAHNFALCWVSNTGESRDPFWTNNAELLILATVLHLRATEPDAPFSRLGDLLGGTSFEQLKELLMTSPVRAARSTAAAFLEHVSLNERLAGSIMTDVCNRFLLLQSDDIRQTTARHEIDFNAMVDRPTGLYISVSHSAARRNRPLTACLTMQMFSCWERRAESSPTGALPRGIVGYLDEFANIGRVPSMGQYVSTLRSKRVALILAIQNFSQLDEVYGEQERKTIVANCITKLVLPGAGQDEIDYFSRRIGETTVTTHTHNQNVGERSQNEGWTEGETGRRLLTPDEIRRMPTGTVLMLTDVLSPMLLKNTPYFRDPSLSRLASIPYQPNPAHQKPVTPAALIPPLSSSTPAAQQHSAPGQPEPDEHFFSPE